MFKNGLLNDIEGALGLSAIGKKQPPADSQYWRESFPDSPNGLPDPNAKPVITYDPSNYRQLAATNNFIPQRQTAPLPPVPHPGLQLPPGAAVGAQDSLDAVGAPLPSQQHPSISPKLNLGPMQYHPSVGLHVKVL